jgi:hypothetical protein
VAEEEDGEYDEQEIPWHNRTPAVVGASVLGVLAIALIVLAATWAAREFSKPEDAPLQFVEPTFSSTESTSTSAPTTTATITTTTRPETTDLSAEPPPPSSSTESSTSRRTRDSDDEGDDGSSTRNRPRTNVTRTVQPFTP